MYADISAAVAFVERIEGLAGHPEVEIICRDRAGAHAEGARSGPPQAVQVADGRHLWRHLAEAVEKTVGWHYECIRSAFATTAAIGTTEPLSPPDGTHDCLDRPRRLVARTRERFAAVQERPAEGKWRSDRPGLLMT